MNNGMEIKSIELGRFGRLLYAAQGKHGGKPIHRGDNLPAHRSLGQFGRVADDGRHAHPSLEEATLLPDPFAGGTAATGAVKMALRIAALVIVHADAVAGFLRVPVVTHENYDRVFPQPMFFQFVDHLADVVISGGHDRAVRAPCRIFYILIQRLMLLERLLRVMRNIKRHIEEEGPTFVFVNKLQGPLHHQFRKIFTGCLHRRGAFIEIMKTGAVQEVMIIVVNEPVTDAKEFIEALLLGSVIAVRAQMPFAVQGSAVSRRLQHFGQRHFL